jgi:hypothetical protein
MILSKQNKIKNILIYFQVKILLKSTLIAQQYQTLLVIFF